MKTLYLSLPNIINISFLLFLIYFVFAVAGMQIFGDATFGANITENCNFKNFYLAVSSLIRFSTGENWNYVMIDLYN